MNKLTLFGIALALIVAIGGYFFHQVKVSLGSAGSTFGTAQIAAVSMNLATAGNNATSSSIQNTSTTKRYVTGYRYGCNGLGKSYTAYTGAGLAALTFTIGTSSTANANTVGATAKVASAVAIATTTAIKSIASTAVGAGSALWKPNEYMTFQTNATNTAACTFGVDYLGS